MNQTRGSAATGMSSSLTTQSARTSRTDSKKMGGTKKRSTSLRMKSDRPHGSLSSGSSRAVTPVFSLECDKLMADMSSWDLDVFKLSDFSGGRPLTAIGMRICEHLGFIKEFKISPLTLCKFYMAIEDGYYRYPEVSYHNNMHAADVLYSTFRLLQHPNLASSISRLEMFAAIVAATVHDVHHPGRTNQFLSETQHEYAIVYNDRVSFGQCGGAAAAAAAAVAAAAASRDYAIVPRFLVSRSCLVPPPLSRSFLTLGRWGW